MELAKAESERRRAGVAPTDAKALAGRQLLLCHLPKLVFQTKTCLFEKLKGRSDEKRKSNKFICLRKLVVDSDVRA
jgi:hypothetical protein